MKKLIFFFFLILIYSGLLALEFEYDENLTGENIESHEVPFETVKDRKFTIQVFPIVYLFDVITLGLGLPVFSMDIEGQYKINSLFNISFSTSFSVNWEFKPVDFSIHLKPMLIYRPLKTGLEGFYIGLYSNIGWHQDLYVNQIITQIGTGFNTGYKWIFRNGFTLQLGTGIGKTWNIPDKSNPGIISVYNADGRLTLRNFDFHIIDFKIGYSF